VYPPDRNPGLLGVPGGALERHPGHVQRGDVPAALGEPDGVGAFTAADVEAAPGGSPVVSVTSAPLGWPLQTRSVLV